MYQNKQDGSAEIQVRNDAFISLRKTGKEKKAIKDGRIFVWVAVAIHSCTEKSANPVYLLHPPLSPSLKTCLEYPEMWWLRIHKRKINAHAKWEMHAFAAITYVQGLGVIAYMCFICQLIFKKVWLPQQLPHSCDLQHATSCTLHSTESFSPWLEPLGLTGAHAALLLMQLPLVPVSTPRGEKAGGTDRWLLSYLTAFWLRQNVDNLETARVPRSPLWWMQCRAAAVGGLPFNARKESKECRNQRKA